MFQFLIKSQNHAPHIVLLQKRYSLMCHEKKKKQTSYKTLILLILLADYYAVRYQNSDACFK